MLYTCTVFVMHTYHLYGNNNEVQITFLMCPWSRGAELVRDYILLSKCTKHVVGFNSYTSHILLYNTSLTAEERWGPVYNLTLRFSLKL